MANLRAKYLYPNEISDIVKPLLIKAFAPYGYKDSTISEDETFDGDPIIRVKADVAQPVPAEELAKTVSRIHDELRARDEERFVFLSAPGPDWELPHGDEDEDLD
jgi:hypothetical protein